MLNNRWSDTTTLNFVRLYLKYTCLWNPSDPAYKVKQLREDAYRKIISDFQPYGKTINVYEVKSKIKSLRTIYSKQVSKILEKSDDPDNIYEPALIWFKEMDLCLKNIVTPKRLTHCDYSVQWPVNDKSENEEDILSGIEYSDSTVQSDEFENIKSEELADPLDRDLKRPSSLHTNNLVKKCKMEVMTEDGELSKLNSPSVQFGDDEFDLFGKYVAYHLRQLGLANALKLQMSIQHILSKARLADII